MNSLDFNSAKSFNLKPTLQTRGLSVTGELTGASLHEAFGTENYEKLNIVEAQLFSATDKYNKKMLVGMTEAKGKLKLINANGFRWELSGSAAQKARITQRINSDSFPGINLTEFDIIVDKPWFNIGDIIIPQDERYLCRVMHTDSSRQYRVLDNSHYQYRVRLVTDNPANYLPQQFLENGSEWCKVSSAVADERNQDAGGFQFFSIFSTEGQVQQHSVEVKMSDKAARKLKVFADAGNYNPQGEMSQYASAMSAVWADTDNYKGPQKEPNFKFMNLLDAAKNERLYKDVEHTLMFGRSSSSMYSPEGHQIFTSAGLREQLESGHVLPHDGELQLEEMEDWFDSILKDRISEGQQKIVLSAGREFRKMFDRMIKADASQYLTVDTHFIRKGSDYNHLDYGSYFATYRGFSVVISVVENEAYDDLYFSPQTDPIKTNVSISSYRADILDFGSSNAQGNGTDTQNICMVAQNYCDYNISYNGKWYAGYDGKSAMPITDGGLGNTGEISGYSMLREKSAGLMIVDVTRCGAIYKEVDEFSTTGVGVTAPADWFLW